MQKSFWIALQHSYSVSKESQNFTDNNQKNAFKSITKSVLETETKGTVSSLFLGADESRNSVMWNFTTGIYHPKHSGNVIIWSLQLE